MAAANKSLAASNKSRSAVPATNKTIGSAAQIPPSASNLARPDAGSALPVFHRLLAARSALKLNMSWYHPDLYFFLCLLAGLAAFLAIIYECIQKFCRRKPDPSSTNSSNVTNGV
jgi:hypothetical protein